MGSKPSLPRRYEVLGAGHVELRDVSGGDLRIVNDARQSFGNQHQTLTKRDEGLIRSLMRNGHGTPFEKVFFYFHVRCPKPVAVEWMRHRIGSFNEFSTRYKEVSLEAYHPADDAIRVQVGKPMRYRFEEANDATKDVTDWVFEDAYRFAFNSYKTLVEQGVAKELARNVLPYGFFTEFTWGVNLRSLLNFVALRSDPAALREIRDCSLLVEKLIEPHVPIAYDAFLEAGRRAP